MPPRGRNFEVAIGVRVQSEGKAMARGDKSKYTEKQDRKAEHIVASYEKRGVPEKEAERRAWATVNKDDGGGRKSGSGRGMRTGNPAAHRGGKLGGAAAAARPGASRSASAKRAAATRNSRRNAVERGVPGSGCGPRSGAEDGQGAS
jgi:plasmid stabilization system protein ParE